MNSREDESNRDGFALVHRVIGNKASAMHTQNVPLGGMADQLMQHDTFLSDTVVFGLA